MNSSTTFEKPAAVEPGTSQPFLVARGVRKSFGDGESRTEVLHGIDLEVAEGDFVAIMGPSGSGKSTLLYCLSGMDAVSDGQVFLGEHEITALPQKQLAELRLTEFGFVFQQVHLLRNLNVLDNVVLPGVTATPKDRDAVVERASGLLDRMGIGELADRGITEASGGQLQRAAIARALVNEPSIVFGDEPTGALNAAAAAEIMDILTEINTQGRTVVLVTHDVTIAARTRRTIVLKDGHVDADLHREDTDDDEAWATRLAAVLTGHGV